MYLVLFSTVNSCVINSVNNILDYQYGGWLGLWSVAGSLVGMIVTEKLVKQTGRPSIFVWVLFTVFLLSVLVTPVFGWRQILQEIEMSPQELADKVETSPSHISRIINDIYPIMIN